MENSSPVTEVEAYVQLFHYIRNKVIPHKKVVPFSQLTEKLEAFMSSKGEVLKTATKKIIRRRFESELGNSRSIHMHIFSQMILESCC